MIGALLLAAGASQRMGTDKLQLDLGGKPLIAHAQAALEQAGLPVIRVGAGGIAVTGQAMSASIRTGIAAVPAEWTGVLICLADMPFVTPADLNLLAAAGLANPDRVIAPHFADKRGNPLLWPRRYFADLLNLSGDHGARYLLNRLEPVMVTCSAGVLIDIDTPEALTAARARIAA
jgi:molybdenum cofactor cytidylyltransferase